ncbi:MAG TPA: hypothetical protein VJZ71_02370 [Phycisphaerae bacterium]|nr:hypothetical protein [Phycisphaerae bacterium]
MDSGGIDDPPSHRAAKALGLAVLLAALRWAYLEHPWPVHGDEMSFVSALGFPAQYPVHHPGYPLWVAMGTALNALGFSPYASYQAWSVAASVLLPVLCYLALRRSVRDSLAWWTALALGVCPLLWFVGTTALNYAAGCTLGWVIIVLCHQSMAEHRARPLLAAALVMAIGLCLRVDLLLTVGPVIAFAVWRGRAVGGFKALLILAGGVILLTVATAAVYGRADVRLPAPHLRHTVDVVLNTSVFRLGPVDGLARNAVKLGINIGWHMGAAALLLPLAVMYNGRGAKRDTRILLLLWWMPTAAFLLLIHMTEPGHMLPLLPPAYCLIALWLNDRFRPEAADRWMRAIVFVSVIQFVAYPWSASSTGFKRILDAKIGYVSGEGLRHIDRRAEIHAPGDFWQTPLHRKEPPTNQDNEKSKQEEADGR